MNNLKVLVTRPRTQAGSFGKALTAAGFEPIYFPVIEIRPIEDNAALDRALASLSSYDWVVFTSVNGVEAVFDRLRAGVRPRRVAAIGPKTAESLRKRGIEPHFVPEEYVAEAIMPGLGDLHGKRVLLPRAEIARKALPEAIAAAGGAADEISVYRTLPAEVNQDGLASLKAGVDVITFTSPSIVHNFVAVVRQHNLDPFHLPSAPRVVCIGPITASAAREAGFDVAFVAQEYTTHGLIKAISQLAAIGQE